MAAVPVFYDGVRVGTLDEVSLTNRCVSVNWSAPAPVPPSLDVQVEIQVDRWGQWQAIQLQPAEGA